MSMQRIPNNGSFLQSYSLKKNIEMLGAEVTFVDFKPGPVLVEEQDTKQPNITSFLLKAKKRIFFPRKKKEIWNRNQDLFAMWEKEYETTSAKYLGLRKDSMYHEKVDTLVIGSDEVFNCLQPNTAVGFSRNLFGEYHNAEHVISYAGSFGNTSVTGLKQVGIAEEIGSLLKQMDGISVRDSNSGSIVKELTGKEPEYHVDPVFLYDFEDEISNIVTMKDYIVVYAYHARLSQEECRHILHFAKKYNKQIVCLAGAQEYIDGFIKTDPFETLAYIKNADYVITDTFHGTVFSIKMNKSFASIVRQGEGIHYGNSNKMEDLFSRFGLKNHIVHSLGDLENILLQKQDYTEINRMISKEKAKSLEYLRRYISKS